MVSPVTARLEVLEAPTIDGQRAWSAQVSFVPKQKGNSKKIAYDKRSPKCPQCGKHERMFVTAKDEDRAAEKSVIKILSLVAPQEPFTADVLLCCSIRLPIPPSWNKAKTEAALAGRVRPTSNKKTSGSIPDLGNLEKLLDDALEKSGWLANDSQIAQRRSEKIYSDEPGYVITIRELPGWEP